MTITQLAGALGVRPATLRFWEQEGLVAPVREGRLGARRYPARAIRQVRIVTALRAARFGIPATARAMGELRGSGGVEALHSVLQTRRSDIARRMELLLRVGTPATARAMGELRGSGGVEALHSVLQTRRSDIARRMELLLRVGTQLVELREDLSGR